MVQLRMLVGIQTFLYFFSYWFIDDKVYFEFMGDLSEMEDVEDKLHERQYDKEHGHHQSHNYGRQTAQSPLVVAEDMADGLSSALPTLSPQY